MVSWRRTPQLVQGQHPLVSSPDIGPLRRFSEQAGGRLLVVHDASSAEIAAAVPGQTTLLVGDRDFDTEPPRRWAAVAAVLTDAAALRRMISTLPRLGRTKSILIWLTEAEEPVLLTRRPEWPAVVSSTARTVAAGGSMTTVVFSTPVLANRVLEQSARDVVPGRDAGNGGLWIAGLPGVAISRDLYARRVSDVDDAVDPELSVPPDVLLAPSGTRPALAMHPVIDRSPLVVDRSPLVGPVDERVFNPAGFLSRVEGGQLRLRCIDDRLLLDGDGVEVAGDASRGASLAMVAAGRRHRDVLVDWGTNPTRQLAHAMVELAAAGVPIVTEVPDLVADAVGRRLRHAVADPADLDDPLRREEHSVLVRRAALLEHGSHRWRADLAAQAGVAFRRFPTVSVLLATKRPEKLDFALRQVSRQRGVDLEIVLVTHGFTVDEGHVSERMSGRNVHVVPMLESAAFGDVLNAALDRASGDVVAKMDDDDWYGPNFLLDLLLAREYSGAEVVGTTAEFVYLDWLDRTVRRNDTCEHAARFVAGGTLTMARGDLRSLGGFRSVRRFVDAQLLDGVRARGGTVYRTHGLNYVLHRAETGHTWAADAEYFRNPARLSAEWEGFRPSRLLEHEGAEAPRAGVT